MSTPQTTIYICSGVRLDNRYEHSIYFDTPRAQQEYFAGKVVKTFPAYSYVRKSWPLQVEATMEQARSWSYLYFQNGTGKIYYYFINQVEYKNDNMVELTLELDVLQTYLFDFTRLDCFVERTHVSDDNPLAYTLDEGLEVGELVDNEVYHWTALNDLCILVMATINPNHAETAQPVEALAGRYNGVFSGIKVWAVDGSKWADWGDQLDALSSAGFLDGIIAMWMYPKALVKLGGENTWDDDDLCKTVDGAKDAGAFLPFSGAPSKVDGYTPKNKKLLNYPYSFLYATNNTGGSAVYRWERFNNYNQPKFTTAGTISPEGNVKMFPTGYNGLQYTTDSGLIASDANYEAGLTLGGFPMCSWDSDVYKMWLAQNQNQLNMATVSGGISIAGGAVATITSALTGNVAGAIGGVTSMVSGAQQIGNLLAQRADMSIQPPQAKGSFSSNVNITAGKHTFSFYKKSVSAENAQVIDDYFTMYGYKVNRVQKPFIHVREQFTYVKTIGCTILGNLCMEDITKIEGIFDRGVTFWTHGDNIGNYSLDNPCLDGVLD